MLVLGIDPGNTKSGWALWQPGYKVHVSAKDDGGAMWNDRLLAACRTSPSLSNVDLIVIERMVIYQASQDTIHDTIVFYGRLVEIFSQRGATVKLVKRSDVRSHFGIPGGKGSVDSKVIKALKQRIGEPGTKQNPGPTFGVTGHSWQALAAAVTGYEGWSGRP
ncbi:hypothetical protein D0962_22965 [Leptolyngbyaceae cyanobacterium CCMR0082]|uniref:Uncharacterized protein n=1 Tax=Adonisia turfae CCMR0082 TaxID=2304604 RepID=A0A6M0SC63_9CYAN|nr:hypothetical protein [Adonisia turfae]NEZ65581.1 hypothetical protein [Adonisia turfae CCMR0082]